MASLAQNIGENPQHVPWNNNDENNNTEQAAKYDGLLM